MSTFPKGHNSRQQIQRNRRTIRRLRVDETRELSFAIPRDRILLTLISRDGDRCYLCRRRSDRYDIDHIIPKIHGGTDDLWNLALACPPCNNRKSSHTVSIRVHDRIPCFHLA